MRAAALLAGVLVSACAADTTPPFSLVIVADDGSVSMAPISPDAVSQIQVVLAPVAADGGFAPMEPRSFEGGDVEARVSAAGEWVLTLRRPWIDRNLELESAGSFQVRVPLEAEMPVDGATRDPTIRVLFFRGTEVIAQNSPRLLAWPIHAGAEINVVVTCRSGSTDQCAGR